MKACRGWRGTALLIPYLGARMQDRVALTPRKGTTGTTLNRSLSGLPSWSGWYGDETVILPLRGCEPRLVQPIAKTLYELRNITNMPTRNCIMIVHLGNAPNSFPPLVWMGKNFAAYIKALCWNLHGRTEENHEKPYSGLPVCGPRFEPVIFRINRDGAHLAAVLRSWSKQDGIFWLQTFIFVEAFYATTRK